MEKDWKKGTHQCQLLLSLFALWSVRINTTSSDDLAEQDRDKRVRRGVVRSLTREELKLMEQASDKIYNSASETVEYRVNMYLTLDRLLKVVIRNQRCMPRPQDSGSQETSVLS